MPKTNNKNKQQHAKCTLCDNARLNIETKKFVCALKHKPNKVLVNGVSLCTEFSSNDYDYERE